MAATATCASQSTENRAMHQARLPGVSRFAAEPKARSDLGSAPPQCGSIALHPIVKIVAADPIKRLGTGWRWWFSESVFIPVGCKIEFRFQGSRHLLALYNEGARRDGETSIDGRHSSNLRCFVHKLTFVPAGSAYREWHETNASTHVAFLYLDPEVLAKSDDPQEGLRPRVHFEDSVVWNTAAKLKGAIESGQAKCMSYLEALSKVLSHELASVDQVTVQQLSVNRGGLAGWQKRVLAEYIEKHLGEPVCLAKLAQLAQLSLHHFCRAFKQSFGIPPHQYQVRRRMENAKLLLADRTLSVTDIAFRVGYTQISSFSFAFRKATGWTPTVYRREFK